MLLSFKTELKPNKQQITSFRKHCGVARHAYNFGNAVILEALQLREADKLVKVPLAIDLHKKLVAEVKSVNWTDSSLVVKFALIVGIIDIRCRSKIDCMNVLIVGIRKIVT